MGKYSHLSAAEIQQKVASGEIDVDDAMDFEWPEHWERVESSEHRSASRQISKTELHRRIHEPTHFLVKIRLSNNRTYELANIPIRLDMDLEDHESEVFHYFYQKLNKRHIHVHKPIHRAIRTSIVDELFVERVP